MVDADPDLSCFGSGRSVLSAAPLQPPAIQRARNAVRLPFVVPVAEQLSVPQLGRSAATPGDDVVRLRASCRATTPKRRLVLAAAVGLTDQQLFLGPAVEPCRVPAAPFTTRNGCQDQDPGRCDRQADDQEVCSHGTECRSLLKATISRATVYGLLSFCSTMTGLPMMVV